MKILDQILLFSGIFALTASELQAQDFEVSPCNINFNANPGMMQSREIVITNHSNTTSNFRLKIQDYDIDEEGHRHVRTRNTVPFSCAQWISISPSILPIDPNSQGVAKVTISVPSDGNESRWAQIVISEAHERTSMGVDASLGAGIVLTGEIVVDVEQTPSEFRDVMPNLTNFVEIEQDSTDNRYFVVTVENQGKTILRGSIYIVAANMETLLEYDILKNGITVRPGSRLKTRFTLPAGLLPRGSYDFSCLLDTGLGQAIKGIRLKNIVEIKPKE